MSSNPFRKRASAECPRSSQDDPTPGQDPPALSTSPNRSRASSWEVVDVPPPSPALRKRSPPPRPPSRNRRSYIPPPETIADPFNPTTESPVSSDFEGNDDILTQEPTEPGRPGTTSFPSAGSDGGYLVAKPGRQSLDADAFKRLMLTGQSSLSTPQTPGASLTPPVVAPDSSTDTSSISRQSIFDPIPEAIDVPDETPRTSNELDEEEERRQSKERTPKPKPPPPRTRNRSGGRSSASPPSSATDIPSLTPPRPPSIHSISSERALPPPPPPMGSTSPILNEIVSPPSPATSIISKKIAPSPPLSRRHSVQSSTNPLRPSTPVGSANNSKMKPPPPPIRRRKSTSSRASTAPLSALSVPPPPPPPPPRRNRSSTANSRESLEEPLTTPPAGSLPPPTEPAIPMIQGTETDILIDLEKLQREVDELRGKYEGRSVGPAVST